MRWTLHHQTLPVIALCLGLGTVFQVGAHEGPTRADGLGDVPCMVSCTEAAQAHCHRAMARYHACDWSRGPAVCAELASLDPRCGMAQWGLAMRAANTPFGWPRPTTISRAVCASKGRTPSFGRSSRTSAPWNVSLTWHGLLCIAVRAHTDHAQLLRLNLTLADRLAWSIAGADEHAADHGWAGAAAGSEPSRGPPGASGGELPRRPWGAGRRPRQTPPGSSARLVANPWRRTHRHDTWDTVAQNR